RPMSLEALTPAGTPDMTGVPHKGTNSLPLFRRFAKVFYRPDGPAAATERWGYNDNSPLLLTTVGPGYYVAYMLPSGEALVDYLRQPPGTLPGAPPLISNGARLSRFVYYQTQDVLRRVSEHVSIGRASRGGKPMPNWFVLCRNAA
ncbi:MAG: hypothetical protein JNG84_07820, partial [Archangium sp.]|nr:hypothetical protein [Archangium sp.]